MATNMADKKKAAAQKRVVLDPTIIAPAAPLAGIPAVKIGTVEIGQPVKSVGPAKVTGWIDGVVIHQTGCIRAIINHMHNGEEKTTGIMLNTIPGAEVTEAEAVELLGGLTWGGEYRDKFDKDANGFLRLIHVSPRGVHAGLNRVIDGKTREIFVYLKDVIGYTEPANADSPVKSSGGWGGDVSSNSL